ncbi:hypothetical protein GQ53DRAFT_859071 [Thozetella sp. PMI_491]|nr:hypothetical protein GQ53DRAFT_859071 [Thozetella sp. PMI_491]
MPSMNSWYYRFLENYVYVRPSPPPRKRTKPMEVLCVGMPRSGTESLQIALLKLGYDYTLHGWDLIHEEPNYAQEWVKLCRKKWFGPLDGGSPFTAEEFDAVLGHSVAVTDAAASVFAAELIAAYPDAKVVLNYRNDLDAWHRSATQTIVKVNKGWGIYLLAGLSGQIFWSWQLYIRLMWPGLFRALDGDIETGMSRNGKWVYREHCNMIRGLVPKERLLEWKVEDGWEPLCEFLGKPVPDEPFPHVNATSGWKDQEARIARRGLTDAVQNLGVIFAVLGGAVAISYQFLIR